MRHIKILMLTLLAGLCMVSCSDDDEKFNTNSVTGGFQSDTIKIKENTGFYNIPIVLNGYRNGDVSVEISVAGSGSNPAEEGVNYRITDKTLSLLEKNDTTNAAQLNIELETIDDTEINENREFTITIVQTKGFEVSRNKVVVVLRDNDAIFYEKFFGDWTLEGTYYRSGATTWDMTISGPSDEDDPAYEKKLHATVPKMMNVGADIDFEWDFDYAFDLSTMQGSLTMNFLQSVIVATYGSAYQWFFLTDDGQYLTEGSMTANWQANADGSIPTEINFDPEVYIYACTSDGWWRYFTFSKMTKK